MPAPVIAGQRAEGRRRIGRAEGRQADLGLPLAERVGGDVEAVDVGHLALVGGHAVGGVALDVLDRAHALAHGEADVLGGDVVLVVDEGARAARVAVGRQFLVADAAARTVLRDRVVGRGGILAQFARGRRAHLGAVVRAPPRSPTGRARRRRSGRLRSCGRADRSDCPRPRRACPWCARTGAATASSRRTSEGNRRPATAPARPCRPASGSRAPR